MTDAVLTDAPPPVAPQRTAARLGLGAICFGFLIITIDTTIVNVALGPIVADLGGSLSGAQWIVSAYTLAFATFLLSGGAWADRVGSRRGFLVGLGLFGVASAACAAAPTMTALIAARVAQGLGAALLMPCSLALITHTFPAGPERRSALAAWGGISGLGLSIGPVLGGALVDGVGWRVIFLINLPIAALSMLGVLAYVSETARHRHPFDLPGQLLVIGVIAFASGRLIGLLGEWRAVVIGLSFGTGGAALQAVFGGDSVAVTILCTLPFAGIAVTMQAMTALAMEGAPRERIGLASGVQNAARQAGGALGVALLGTLLSATGSLELHLPMAAVAAAYLAAVGLALYGRASTRAGGREIEPRVSGSA